MVDTMICPACGMPDVREVLRITGIEHQAVYYVDLRCLDCDWEDRDTEGGV